jgi:hypothetical protein
VAGNVEKREAPTLLRERLEIRLDKNLDDLFAVINPDADWRVAEIDLMSSSVLSSNDGVGHGRLALKVRRRHQERSAASRIAAAIR